MNLFGLSSIELFIIVIVAILVLGPSGFAQAMRGFRKAVDTVKSWSKNMREEARQEEFGISGIDFSSIDLNQYNPREIVREAVREEMDAWMKHNSNGTSARPKLESDKSPKTTK